MKLLKAITNNISRKRFLVILFIGFLIFWMISILITPKIQPMNEELYHSSNCSECPQNKYFIFNDYNDTEDNLKTILHFVKELKLEQNKEYNLLFVKSDDGFSRNVDDDDHTPDTIIVGFKIEKNKNIKSTWTHGCGKFELNEHRDYDFKRINDTFKVRLLEKREINIKTLCQIGDIILMIRASYFRDENGVVNVDIITPNFKFEVYDVKNKKIYEQVFFQNGKDCSFSLM